MNHALTATLKLGTHFLRRQCESAGSIMRSSSAMVAVWLAEERPKCELRNGNAELIIGFNKLK